MDFRIFRDGRRRLETRSLVSALAADLQALGAAGDADGRRRVLVRALVGAGELESVSLDLQSTSARALSRITDDLAGELVGEGTLRPSEALDVLVRVDLPRAVRASPPESFSYYALHPLDYARVADAIPVGAGRAAVVGLRTIGTTLGAVVAAALRRRGIEAQRITARPAGHAYDRRLCWDTDADLRWVKAEASQGATFFVVDEGPGRSGSSLLSGSDALAQAGVPRGRIALLCSHAPDTSALWAPDAARRFAELTLYPSGPSAELPDDAGAPVDGGRWRRLFWRDEARWPAVWPLMERRKVLSRDGQRLLKFEGLGRHGRESLERAMELHRAGFGPEPRDEGEGFLAYPLAPGRPLGAEDLTPGLVARLAHYCAFRARAFPAEEPATDALERMIRENHEAAFGDDDADSRQAVDLQLEVRRPIVADARMMPHEWVGDPASALKTDGISHGDDHFLPGPVDVAWDLAGAIVEWRMDAAARALLLATYRSATGDDAEDRLPAYLVAYALLRLGVASTAAASVGDPAEAARLLAEARRYREHITGVSTR